MKIRPDEPNGSHQEGKTSFAYNELRGGNALLFLRLGIEGASTEEGARTHKRIDVAISEYLLDQLIKDYKQPED
jgi:hypothetical protein